VFPRVTVSSFFRCRNRSVLGWVSVFAILYAPLQPSALFAQGFGANKKTIALTRKLPAVIHLPGTAIDVQCVASQQANAEVAQGLSDVLLVTLQKNDTRLHEDKNAPDVTIKCKVITYETPPPKTFTRTQTVYQNKRWVQVPVLYYKITGELSVVYQAVDAHKRTLDAGTITKKYAQDFQAGTNQSAGGSGESDTGNSSVLSKIDIFHKKKGEENMGPPNAVELRQKLIEGVVSQLAPRVVNTQETIEVMLARGKPFDEANKLAEKGRWTQYTEALETMNPLPKPEDDAYRLYNIGVANEALAYQAEDRTSTQKFLDQAAINYGKAIDAKPSEKYFIEPQNRIEMAAEHYRKLAQGADTKGGTEPTEAESKDSGSVKPVSTPSPASKEPNNGASASKPRPAPSKAPPSGNSAAKPSTAKPTGPPLANADIIKMAKAGVDEESIIASIQEASSVNFDFSPDSLIALANAGAKGKIVTAMRARARKQQARAASSGSNK
jgi:hypothetical protein